MPRQIATATVEGTRKRGRRDEVEEDLKVMDINTSTLWLETVRNGGSLYWKPGSAAGITF